MHLAGCLENTRLGLGLMNTFKLMDTLYFPIFCTGKSYSGRWDVMAVGRYGDGALWRWGVMTMGRHDDGAS